MPSHSETSLKAGLTALKQGDYQTAEEILEAVVVTISDRMAVIQAQIGLVVVYARTGETAKAIALCETLTKNERPQVKEWAERSLQELTKRYNKNAPSHALSTTETTNLTGLVPLENSPPPPPTTPESEVQESVNQEESTSIETLDNTTAEINQTNRQTRIFSPVSIPHQLPKGRKRAHGASFTLPPPPPPPPPPNNSPASVHREKAQPLTIYWRQAGRAKVWQPLSKRGSKLLKLLEIGTFIALFWVIRALFVFITGLFNDILVKLPFLEPIQLLYQNPTVFLLVLLLTLMFLSPWLLDRLLTKFYGNRQLDQDVLNRYSKESVRVLQRYCRQRRWQIPKLYVMPIAAPLALTYGSLRRNARIVVSRGLLEQLRDDEIATIYGSQLGHIANRDFMVMSLVLLVTIPVYRLYQQFSHWGDNTSQPIWRSILGVMGSLVYGVWCLLVGTGLWLSQVRLYFSDRIAVDVTGNPNGLVRALLKIAIGIADDVHKQEHTSWQLESLNIVMPVGYKQSLCLGSIAPYTTFESFLMWDILNPYRWWFVVNNTHPLIGDRVKRLCMIARHWHIDPELYLENQHSLRVKRQSFLLQIAPFLGGLLGVVFAVLIWLGWQTAYALKVLNLKWIYDDWNFVTGCMLIGFSIGILLRINSFFPNIQPDTVQTDERLPNLLTNPATLPIDSISIRLVGKLLGRRGTSNYLGQDLILESSTGLVKLHHISWLGQSVNAQDLIGRQIIVKGWLRRGATPWIDVQTLQTQGGKIINSPHPIWSVVVAVAAEVWGAYILLTG